MNHKPLVTGAVFVLAFQAALAAARDRPGVIDERHKALLQGHCVKCHTGEKAEGKFRVDTLPFAVTSVAEAERWQKVLNALNSGTMPPDEEKQPESRAKADFLDDLAHALVAARRGLGDQTGTILMRRLNRREYRNSLRTLLGVATNVDELPADTGIGGFDTAGANLFMSSDQVEQYLALGREALDEAFELRRLGSATRQERFEAEAVVDRVRESLRGRIDMRRRYTLWSRAVDEAAGRPENQAVAAEIRAGVKDRPPWDFYPSWKRLAAAPSPTDYGFTDAETATHEGVGAWNLVPYQTDFLVRPELKTGAFLTVGDNGVNPWFTFAVGYDWPPGDYVVRVRVAATKQAAPERKFLEFGVPPTLLSTHEVLGTMEAPQVIEAPFTLTKDGGHLFFVREKGTMDTNEQANRKQGEGARLNGIGPEFALWVDWAEVVRNPETGRRPPPGLAALGIPLGDEGPTMGPGELRGALERFALEACRGNVPPPGLLDRLVGLYDRRRKAGTPHSAALKEALAVVLASPRFLYLTEPSRSDSRRELTANELAIRLSFFLWGAPPDAALRDLAARGELLKPEVLTRQADRLMDDPRRFGFVTPFVHQWLGLNRLDFFRFNNARYPTFDDSAKMAARAEVHETFGYLLREDSSLRNLLKSDFVVVNSLLANYYGIEGVTGDAYRRVELPKGSPRGGLLGMAAILAMGSNGEQTSPVERGAWVLRKLLNDPPPPAPPNVPQLSRLESRLLTTRERVREHQEQPQCASCHRKIDPVGFGLENFDAVGRWRTEDAYEKPGLGKKSWTIDPAGAFHNGPAFESYFDLRDVVASRPEAFARGFSGALLEYALGRPRVSGDEPLVAKMVNQARDKDFAMREFIRVLVKSDEFRRK